MLARCRFEYCCPFIISKFRVLRIWNGQRTRYNDDYRTRDTKEEESSYIHGPKSFGNLSGITYLCDKGRECDLPNERCG